MANIAADGRAWRRHPVRIFAFVAMAALAAGVLGFLVNNTSSGTSSSGEDSHQAAVFSARPRHVSYGPRIPLYLVSSDEDARRLEWAIARNSYVELTGGIGQVWAIEVMQDGMTLAMIEELNLTRIGNGLLPYRVIDARRLGNE